jgi:hypothetical protein
LTNTSRDIFSATIGYYGTVLTRKILCIETGHGGESNPGEEMEDVSAVLRFFFLVFFSFFATGNIASLNSFDPSSIR